jgi:phosphatidate cytidylyltransferase
MLRTRVITAVAILAILLGMLFLASSSVWALFMLAVALAGCWEWSRLARLGPRGQAAFLLASGALGGFLWVLHFHDRAGIFERAALGAFVAAALFWIVAAPAWLARGLRPGPAVSAIAGWLVLWPAWLAFVVLRDASPWLLLAIAALVWVADIAAYFAGRRFGRHKLAPTVSPGKTWEGVAGALVGAALYGAALALAAPASPQPLRAIFEPAGGAAAIVAMLCLVAVSVVGDLFESWMKRGAGLKDSSALLPGHGGILDRIDALAATLPVAALAVALSLGHLA